MLDIVSPDPARQADAAFVCYFVGREDGRALVLLRRLLFTLHPDVFAYAADQLAHAIPHPDHPHTQDTMVSREARATLRESLDWSSSEIRQLLTLVDDENGFGRGSFGQTVFHLIVEGRNHLETLREATVAAAREGDQTVASWGLVLVVYLAGAGGRATLDEMLTDEPALAAGWAADQLESALREHGAITL